jgi:uncharacterized protein (DUF1330 family)
MPAYVIVDHRAADLSGWYEEYRRRNREPLQRFGGRVIVRGGEYEQLEGDWRPGRVIVIEFPDREAARGWYHSDEYRALTTMRQANSESTGMILIDGLEPSETTTT